MLKSKILSILFFLMSINIFGSSRTNFYNLIENFYKGSYYCTENNEIVKISCDENIIYIVNFIYESKNKKLTKKSETKIDILKDDFSIIENLRKKFLYVTGEYDSSDFDYSNGNVFECYYENKNKFYYIPCNTEKEIIDYLTAYELSESKSLNVSLLCDDYHIYEKNTRIKIFYDKYGYKNIQGNDFNSILIDGDNPVSLNFYYNGTSLAEDKSAVNQYFDDKYIENFYEFEPKAKVTASSSLKDKYYDYLPSNVLQNFTPENIFEFSKPLKFKSNLIPWVEGKKGDGIGECLEYELSKKFYYGTKLYILSGYVNPLKPYLFRENNRLKKILIEGDNGFKKEISFEDCVEFQSLYLDKEVKKVKITILEVYKGTKYDDTCISSIVEINSAWDK